MPDLVPSYRLTEEAIRKMLDAAVEKARSISAPAGIGIVDAGGGLRAWILMDGATPLAFDAVLKKARTAAFTGQPTGGIPDEISTGLALAMPDFANLVGALPIVKDGEVLGAIAAGGAKPDEDLAAAAAGLDQLDLAPGA